MITNQARVNCVPGLENQLRTLPLVNPVPRKSVIIVDDEISYTNLLTQLLSENLDCRVIAFTRPLDALAALPELDAGVIVTDYYMPQLDGLEFIAQASHLAPAVPFILITGHTISLTSEELAEITPLKKILPKPFSWRKLGDEIIRLWPEPGVNLLRAEAHPASV